MRTLDVTCGIYDTEYKLTAHKDGSLTIKAPYIKWANNNGNLAFRTVKIPSGEVAEKILWCFDNQEIEMPGYDYRTVYQEIEEWCFNGQVSSTAQSHGTAAQTGAGVVLVEV